MSRSPSLLFGCCLALTALWPSRAGADGLRAFHPAAAAAVNTSRAFKLQPPRGSRSDRSALFASRSPATLRLRSPRIAGVAAWGTVQYVPPVLPFFVNPLVSAWAARSIDGSSPDLRFATPENRVEAIPRATAFGSAERTAHDWLASLGMGSSTGYGIPTLLRYSDEETNVSLSISPGGPCTGACLKVAGSF